jgi:DNA-binding NarL/FixJ family response regulator
MKQATAGLSQLNEQLQQEIAVRRRVEAALQESQRSLSTLLSNLPGLTPADTLTRLRTAFPRLKVVALSGRSEARQSALAAGADAFVSKGSPPERLLAALNTICEESSC